MTEPNTERFHRNANGPPDRWRPPDRDIRPIMRLRTSATVPLTACISERTSDSIRFQETIPYFSANLNLRTKELTAGRCSVVPLPKQIRVPSGSFNTFINKNNQAPIGPISRTMGQATGGRLL